LVALRSDLVGVFITVTAAVAVIAVAAPR